MTSPPAPLTLVIGNKNYSSWSARPWLTMTQLGIPFAERMIKFDSKEPEARHGTVSRAAKNAPGTWVSWR